MILHASRPTDGISPTEWTVIDCSSGENVTNVISVNDQEQRICRYKADARFNETETVRLPIRIDVAARTIYLNERPIR